ncbi:hypothetical protein ACWD4B_04695 [Streptomyces sp. NPDC002536]
MTTIGSSEAAWEFCEKFSSRIYRTCKRDVEFCNEIRRRYQNWEVDPDGTDSKVRLLICLGLHCLTLDQLHAGGDPERIAVAAVSEAVHTRPVHELFASLPALPPVEASQVDAMKLMAYSLGSGHDSSAVANYWARITGTALSFLKQAADATRYDSPDCGQVLSMRE